MEEGMLVVSDHLKQKARAVLEAADVDILARGPVAVSGAPGFWLIPMERYKTCGRALMALTLFEGQGLKILLVQIDPLGRDEHLLPPEMRDPLKE